MSFDFKSELASRLDLLGLEVVGSAYDSLDIYFHQLKKWSKKVNLIAKATSDKEIVEKHFLDSLTLIPFLKDSRTHLLDIGTGGGFPGLVCKAALGGAMQLTLVEPRLKRVSFLRHIVRTTGLTGVEIYPKRLEEVPQLTHCAFSHITCRAVTEIAPFLEMVSDFDKTAAKLICMKGPRWSKELDNAEEVIEKSGYSVEKVVEYVLPSSKARRALLFFSVS